MPKVKLVSPNRLFRSNVLWERDVPQDVTAAEAEVLLQDARWASAEDEDAPKLEAVKVEAVGAPLGEPAEVKKPGKITIKKGKGHPSVDLGDAPLDTGEVGLEV